jgi:sugar phosphate isomerase/epimerase
MMITTKIRRPLGTMVVYGFPKLAIEVDLVIARQLGAEVVEVLPDWRAFPDPLSLRARVSDLGLKIHSAHGCWGGQSIRAQRVDLGSNDHRTWTESVDDLERCVDWLEAAGGTCLVIHPGGLSEPVDVASRRDMLTCALCLLADHASGTGVTICVENMPPGVYPGSRMIELREIIDQIDRPEIAIALDTGHARISNSAPLETLEAGKRLRTTHVHDNDGRQDTHLPPGSGTIDWGEWVEALDAIDYRGPIMLECIKHLRDRPESLTPELIERLRRLCGLER